MLTVKFTDNSGRERIEQAKWTKTVPFQKGFSGFRFFKFESRSGEIITVNQGNVSVSHEIGDIGFIVGRYEIGKTLSQAYSY
jgi:hypothetical protein